MKTLKHFIARLLFGKPLLMSVFEDENGNKYGGSIHKDDGKSYLDITPPKIKNPKWLGKCKIYGTKEDSNRTI